MPWRLIIFLLCLLLVLVFAGFNMNNSSNISFGFYELKDVPVFVSLLFSFIIGVLFALPFIFIGRRNVRKSPGKETEEIPVKKEPVFPRKVKKEKPVKKRNEVEDTPFEKNSDM